MDFGQMEAIAIRKKVGLTHNQLAKAFHLSEEDIVGYENGLPIPELVQKQYQLYIHTGKERPEDFEGVPDYGSID